MKIEVLSDRPLNKRRIALFAPIRTGKTTIARALIANGYFVVSFAEPVKRMLMALGLPEHDVRVDKTKPQAILGGKTCRDALTTLGTGWGRDMIGPDIWARAAQHAIQQFGTRGFVVVDDLRYENEQAILEEEDFTFVKLVRDKEDAGVDHSSEANYSILRADLEITLSDESELEDHQRGHAVANLLTGDTINWKPY
jgi:hypothetical protein